MAGLENEHIFGLHLRESATDGSDFSNADADYRRVFLGEDGQLHAKDASGTVTDLGGAGGGSSSFPTVVQIAVGSNAVTSQTISAAASGNRLILVTNATTGQVTSPTCTNVTWTQLVTFTSAGGSFYAIWVGVVAGGSSGTSITMTKAGSFNSVAVLEITDAVTPTAGQTATANGSATAIGASLASTTLGHLVVAGGGSDNTTIASTTHLSIPTVGLAYGPVTALVGYSLGQKLYGQRGGDGTGSVLIVEVT